MKADSTELEMGWWRIGVRVSNELRGGFSLIKIPIHTRDAEKPATTVKRELKNSIQALKGEARREEGQTSYWGQDFPTPR